MLAATSSTPLSSKLVGPSDPAVEARDRKRRRPGSGLVKATVTASPVKAVVGGREVATWAFGDRPGAGGIRAKVGDLIEATFVDKLPSANTLHWHGIALRNDMDGVHGLTQSVVHPGRTFTYRFTAPDAGTYRFHPHMGLELDKGPGPTLRTGSPSPITSSRSRTRTVSRSTRSRSTQFCWVWESVTTLS